MTVGWKLRPDERNALLTACPPRYERVVADHVTLVSPRGGDAPLPVAAQAQVVGRADDAVGVEALVVAVDGSVERPGGGILHITWSLTDGRRAKESNDVIAALGWAPVDVDLPVLTLVPARW